MATKRLTEDERITRLETVVAEQLTPALQKLTAASRLPSAFFPVVGAEEILAALGPEYTLRDSTESACGVASNILDLGEERTVLAKVKNTGRAGTDCPFTVNLKNAAGAAVGSQALNPGQSTSLRRRNVQTVELNCGAVGAAGGLCKASYSLVVNRD